MKLQGLAIIFILIILPITLVIGEYANTQKETIKLEQLYDSRLINATHDALKAFQINTFNDATSDIVDSKIKSIQASVNAFYNSMESSFGLQGYSKEDLHRFVPALVYTMYDGYYIYSPYTNVANISSGEGVNIDLNSNEITYGFKPYVYYSCRYQMGENSDFVINYSLDNYITVQGIVNGESVYKSGYLVTMDRDYGVHFDEANNKYYYNGVEIQEEHNLTDNLVDQDSNGNITTNTYKYIKLNGTKYYWNESEEYIFYILGGNRIKQATRATNEEVYNEYVQKIRNNTSAISYYKDAYEFSSWVEDNLEGLTTSNAVSDIENKDGTLIFANNKIEYPSSNFNLHRKEVIRYSIESNLSVAIANFNSYTNSGNNFQMPKLKETEWEMLQSEISIISFLQGLNIGGKIYNGYTVVTNNKTQELVHEESIYITTNDGYYHKVNDKDLIEKDKITNEYKYNKDNLLIGALDLDFETRKDGATASNYTQKTGLGCYGSIVGLEYLNNEYDSIYEYLHSLDETEDNVKKLKEVYYTAFGRERFGKYKVENPANINIILSDMPGDEEQEDEEYITAATLKPEHYGGYITNYTPRNGVNNEGIKWRIFHSDGENIYLIANYQVPVRNYVPTGYNLINGTCGFNLAYSNYNGTADINSNIASKWLRKYTTTSTNINAKATAYLLDTNAWSGFKDSTYANYAVGAPTIELFAASYNKKYPDRTIETQVTSTGYQVAWSGGNFQNSISDLNKSESLYVIGNTVGGAEGMWLASPLEGSDNQVMAIARTANVIGKSYSSHVFRFSPNNLPKSQC